MIQKLTPFKPITGDDLPTYSISLSDIGTGHHFKDLIIPERATLTLTVKDRLLDYCERYYRHHNIVGLTIVDWFDNLQLALDENIDNFEKFLAVYDDDIAKPVLGREMKTTHIETESSNGSGTNTNKVFDLPVDNNVSQEIERNEGSNSAVGSRTINYTDTQTMSDVGVTNNWEKLNGFLDNNPTMEMIFRNYFKNCFTLYEVLYW